MQTLNNVFVDTTTINAVVSGIVTLTPFQSGTTFIMTKLLGTPTVINLPSPTIAGLKYRFYLSATIPVLLSIVSPNGASSLIGFFSGINGNKTPSTIASGDSELIFENIALAGDYADFTSDGTLWHVEGSSGIDNGFLFV
jgi:CBS domain containing-hemolysin-like protein